MSIISLNTQDAIRQQAFIDQIWSCIEAPHQTICYDPAFPLFCPPPLIHEVRYAIH